MIKKLLMLVLLAAPLSLFAQKFAHFNYSEVMQNLPSYKTAAAELETLGKKYEAEMTEMQKEIQTKYEKYQKEDTEETPQNVRDRHVQELQQLQERLQQAYQDNQQSMQQEQQKKMQPIIMKVQEAVDAVAKEGGYVYVIDKDASQAAGMFINTALSTDVTTQVKAKLGIQ